MNLFKSVRPSALAAALNGKGISDAGSSRDKMIEDLRGVIDEAQDLIQSVTDPSGERYRSAKDKLSSTLEDARALIDATRSAAQRNVGKALDTADEFVSANPWRAVIIAVSVGLTVAFLAMLASRSSGD